MRKIFLFGFLIVGLILSSTRAANAAVANPALASTTWHVTQVIDNGSAGTLSYALSQAQSGDAVVFDITERMDVNTALVVPAGVSVGATRSQACVSDYHNAILNIYVNAMLNPAMRLGAGATLRNVNFLHASPTGNVTLRVVGDDVDVCGVGMGIGYDGDGNTLTQPPGSAAIIVDGASANIHHNDMNGAIVVTENGSATRIGDAVGGSGQANRGYCSNQGKCAVSILKSTTKAARNVTVRDVFPRALSGIVGAGTLGGDDVITHANHWASTPVIASALSSDNFASVVVQGTASPNSLVDIFFDDGVTSLTRQTPVSADATGAFTFSGALPGSNIFVIAISTLNDPAQVGRIGSTSQWSGAVKVTAGSPGGATATPVATATPTQTQIPTQTRTPTQTPAPPTQTQTPTQTSAPPTQTQVPPTPSATATPQSTEAPTETPSPTTSSPIPTSSPAPTTTDVPTSVPGSGLVLYDDARAPGWADWSTAITPTWDSPAPVLAGTKAVRVQVNAPYGTLTLRGQSSVNTQPFDALSFWVYGGPDGNSLAAFVQSGDASPPSRFVFFTAEPNTWRFVRIRLGAFGDFAQIKRVNIQDISGQSGGSFSVDQIALLPQQVAGTTGDAIVYDDALAATWQSWSYGISANFASTSVVQSGAKAIAVQISQTWGTLGLRNAVALDATPYDAVQFDVYGDGSQGPLVVFLQEGDATQPSNYIFFSPPQGTWTHIKIPLGLFGFVTQIKRISIQDASGSTGARFFVDNLRLSVPSVPAAIAHAQHANRTAVDGLLVMALNARVTHGGNALSWRLQGADANNVRVYRSATDDWSVAQLVATSAAIGQWQDTAANRNATYWLKATLANGSEIGMGPIHPEAAVFVSGSKVFLPVVLR